MTRSATQLTDEMTPVGALIQYEPDAASCAAGGCDKTAAKVVVLGKQMPTYCPAHEAERDAQLRAEEVERRAALYMATAGQTVRRQNWSFDSYRAECGDEEGLAALAVAERWCERLLSRFQVSLDHDDGDGLPPETVAAPNLLFYGPIGSGKTGLAWAIVRHLCERGVEARLVNFRSLLDAMKDCFAKREPITNALGVGKLPVLVLDDLGSEQPKPWAREQLLGIVDFRYEMSLPTIYVSNYDPDKLAKILGHDDPLVGDRIVSRMTDGAMQHRFRAPDRRKLAA